MNETSAPQRKRLLYGRTQGHKLREGQQRLLESLLPEIQVRPDNPQLSNPIELFSHRPEKIFLEVGFGGGEHLAHQACEHPEYGYVGAEPFINGIAKLLSQIESQSINNVRPYLGDARDIIEQLGDDSIASVFLLYPDPWSKKRHNKRRFVNQDNLQQLHRILQPRGEFFFASDITDYVRWTLAHIQQHGGFEWTAESATDWRTLPVEWPSTRYEAKAFREGRTGHYLRFRKL